MLVDENTCTNDGQIQAFGDSWQEMINENRHKKIIQLPDKSCFDIDELVQIMISRGDEGQAMNWNPGTHDHGRIWNNLEELNHILNFPGIEKESKKKLKQLLKEEIKLLKGEKVPRWVELLYSNQEILNTMADVGIDVLGDYTDDFAPSYIRLSEFNDLIEKTFKGKDLQSIYNLPSYFGDTFKKTMAEVSKHCIHGAGFFMTSFYLFAYTTIRSYYKDVELHPGFKEMSKKDTFIFGYPYLGGFSPDISVCYYNPKESAKAKGGSGRILAYNPYKGKFGGVGTFNYNGCIINSIRSDAEANFKDLISYYDQRLFDLQRMQKRIKDNKQKNNAEFKKKKQLGYQYNKDPIAKKSKKIDGVQAINKSCQKVGTHCKPYDGPMNKECQISDSGRCVVIKPEKKKKSKKIKLNKINIINSPKKKKNMNINQPHVGDNNEDVFADIIVQTGKNKGKIRSTKSIKAGKCIFPFLHQKKLVNNCVDGKDGKWCATSLNYKNKLDTWGYCI